jgi:hypothetical protein
LLDISGEDVVSPLGLTGGDLQRDGVEGRVIAGGMTTHHRGDLFSETSHGATS